MLRVASQCSSYMSWYSRCSFPSFSIHPVLCLNHSKTNHLDRLHWHNVGYTQECFQLVDEWFHSGQWRKYLSTYVGKSIPEYILMPFCILKIKFTASICNSLNVPSFSVDPLPSLDPPKWVIYEYCTRIMSDILRNILRLLMKYFIKVSK